MEDKTNKELPVIDINDIAKKLWAKKMLFAKTLSIAFVLACVFILGFPRYYTTEIKLAPELGGGSGMTSTLGSLASSFGFDLDNLQSNDAITPLLYPDLMEDNGFVTSMFKIQVKSKDGSIKTNYYDYLKKHQKPIIWLMPKNWIKKLFKSSGKGEDTFTDPYYLSENEDDIAGSIRDKIKINFDKKTAVISIEIKDQDALICKTIGDSVKERLQDFITDYRTSKARNDYNYYMKLTMEAKQDYEKARQRYGSMADANSKVALRSVEMKLEDMENDLQLKFNAYTTVSTQMQAAKAKVQERTPAFTVIKGASVPIKPAGPKRMIFVVFILLLTFAGTSFYILRR